MHRAQFNLKALAGEVLRDTNAGRIIGLQDISASSAARTKFILFPTQVLVLSG